MTDDNEVRHPVFVTDHQRHVESAGLARSSARSAGLTAAFAEELVQQARDAEKRDRQMLLWARVAAVAAIAALVVSIVALILT